MYRHPSVLSRALIAHGLVPKNCRSVELVMTPDSVTVLRYEVTVDVEDMAKLALALQEASDEQRRATV